LETLIDDIGLEQYNLYQIVAGNLVESKRNSFARECGCGIGVENAQRASTLGSKLSTPLQLGWTVSRKCNFRCPHCFNNSSPEFDGYEVPRDIIIDNIIDARPFNLCLCGGEVFTWDDLGYITNRLRDGGVEGISAVTNAYFATYDRLKEAFDNGLSGIQISFDGSSPGVHGKYRPAKDSWQRAKQAISDALSIDGFKSVAVSMLPNRYNVDSFPEYVSMLVDMGVKSIRVQPLMPIGRGAESHESLNASAEDQLRLALMIRRLNLEITTFRDPNVHIEWGDPLDHIWSYQHRNYEPLHGSIQVNGWFELSPYIPVLVADLSKHSIREVWSKSIKEMWNIPLMRKFGETLSTIDGMARIQPRIYFDDHILIDRFDEENWQLAQSTDDAQVLIDYARKKGLYEMK